MFTLYVLLVNLLHWSGYIIGTVLIFMGVIMVIQTIAKYKIARPLWITLVPLIIGLALIAANRYYHYTLTSEYQQRQLAQREASKHRDIAAQAGFTLYKAPLLHRAFIRETAFADTSAYRQKPYFITQILHTRDESRKVTIYQYGRGSVPDPISARFKSGDCATPVSGEHCVKIAESSFGTIFKIERANRAFGTRYYFAQKQDTNILLVVDNEISEFTEADVKELFDQLEPVGPSELPF